MLFEINVSGSIFKIIPHFKPAWSKLSSFTKCYIYLLQEKSQCPENASFISTVLKILKMFRSSGYFVVGEVFRYTILIYMKNHVFLKLHSVINLTSSYMQRVTTWFSRKLKVFVVLWNWTYWDFSFLPYQPLRRKF